MLATLVTMSAVVEEAGRCFSLLGEVLLVNLDRGMPQRVIAGIRFFENSRTSPYIFSISPVFIAQYLIYFHGWLLSCSSISNSRAEL